MNGRSNVGAVLSAICFEIATSFAIRGTRRRSWWARKWSAGRCGLVQGGIDGRRNATGRRRHCGHLIHFLDMDERLIHPTLDAIRRPHVPEPERLGQFHEREFIARLETILDHGLRAVVGG
jgi:hypothetical protein